MLTVSITGYKEGKPVLYHVLVDRGDGTKPYTLDKRYNDFLELSQEFKDEMGEPVAVAPPPKPKFFESVDLKQRQKQLEQMIQALVRIPAFAESFAVGNFLNLYSKQEQETKTDVISNFDYIKTLTEVSKLMNQAKQATSTNTLKKRQLVVQIKSLLNSMQSSLDATKTSSSSFEHQPVSNNDASGLHGGSISSAERNRRQQQLDDFFLGLQSIELSLSHTDRSIDAYNSTTSLNSSMRVLGETPATVNLNNRELVQAQQQSMESQEEAIEYLRSTVARQRELGEAIHGEIVRQNELLEDLDQGVNKVNAKLNYAKRKTERLGR